MALELGHYAKRIFIENIQPKRQTYVVYYIFLMSTTIQPLATAERSGPSNPQPAASSGTFMIGGDLAVHRLGFGTMQLTGPGVWGEPTDRAEAIAVLRRAVDLGINLFDTAES